MLTFEEWRHTYADVFETEDAARAAWTAASNHGYRAGAQDTRALLTAHSAGVNGMTPERRFHFANRMIHIDDLEDRIALVRAIERELLAAHSAGAQEPVAEIVRWLDFTNKPRFDIKVIDETLEHGAKLYAHPQPQTDASRHLSDLLARIHRDGGHYETQYGTEKATADAEMKVAQLNEMTDAARDAAWLIEWPAEESMPARWWNPLPNMGWVTDATRAVRFARKDDAEAYIHCGRHQFVAGVIATEHIFDAEIERGEWAKGD